MNSIEPSRCSPPKKSATEKQRDMWLAERNRISRALSREEDQTICDRMEARYQELMKLIGDDSPGAAARGAH